MFAAPVSHAGVFCTALRGDSMSRAIDLKLAEAEVRTWCTKHNIATSVIEPLPSGGTHLVCITGAGAEEVRLRLGKQIMPETERRFRFYRARAPF